MTRNPQDELLPGGRSKAALHRGWTMGACVVAATKAAYLGLLTGRFPDPVQIILPSGEQVSFDLVEARRYDQDARVSIQRDGGDDPDVMHGAIIRVGVCRADPGSGVLLIGGEGVGVVTSPGLPIMLGTPAIDIGPHRLMIEIIQKLAQDHGDRGDLEITMSVPGGEVLAKKIAASHRGVVGGIAINGTGRVPVPSSSAAWLAGIQSKIDQAHNAGIEHIAFTTGSTSKRALDDVHSLPDRAVIEIGDFIGGTFRYLRDHPMPRVTIAGGFAKISKLADGHLNLDARRSLVDLEGLANLLAMRGASDDLLDQVKNARATSAVLELARAASLPLGDDVAEQARTVAIEQIDGMSAVEVIIFDKDGQVAGRAGAA